MICNLVFYSGRICSMQKPNHQLVVIINSMIRLSCTLEFSIFFLISDVPQYLASPNYP